MSYDFFSLKTVTARKSHICTQCLSTISIGEKYSRAAGKFDGCMVDYCEHLDCREAWVAHNEHVGRRYDDELPFFPDDEDLDVSFIREKYPAVLDRMNIAKSRKVEEA